MKKPAVTSPPAQKTELSPHYRRPADAPGAQSSFNFEAADREGPGGCPHLSPPEQAPAARSAVPAREDGRRDDLKALPADWRLVRVGRNKQPLAGDDWFAVDDFSPDGALSLNGAGPPAWGLKTGPASGGLLALDLDAEGWEESFQEKTGHRISDLPETIAWTSGKPGRSGHAFTVDREWWPLMRNRASFTRPWREGDPLGKDGKRRDPTLWELRWDRHQSVILGAHPTTEGYRWLEGRSPVAIPDPAPAPDWLLELLLVQELPNTPQVEPTAADAARAVLMLQVLPPGQFTSYGDWLKVGMALHHTDAGLLSAWVDWCRPMGNFDEAECLEKWDSFGKGYRGRPFTIASLHHWAKQHGYKEPSKRSRGGQQDGQAEVLPSYRELLANALAAIRRRDEDGEMEARAELMGRFKRSDAQITAALFRLLTEQETGRPAGDAPNADSLDLDSIEGMDALVDGFIPANDLGLAYGAKGSGKTAAGLALSFAVIDGTGFLDHSRSTEQGAALFIASDSGAAPLKAEMQRMGLADHPAAQGDAKRFHVWAYSAKQQMTAWCASINGCVELLQFVKAKGIRLVVIDSAKTICAKAGINYLDNDSVAALLTFMKETICAHAAVLILSHDGTEKGSHSGAKAWAEVPSIVHNIQLIPDAPQERLWRVVKNRMGGLRELRYQLGEGGQLEPVAGVEVIGDASAAVVKVLTEAHKRGVESVSSRELVAEIGHRFRLAPKTVANTLTRMVGGRKPEICRVPSKRGHYNLAPRLLSDPLNSVRVFGKEEGKNPVRERDLTSSRPLPEGRTWEEGEVLPDSSHFPTPGKTPNPSGANGSGGVSSHETGGPKPRGSTRHPVTATQVERALEAALASGHLEGFLPRKAPPPAQPIRASAFVPLFDQDDDCLS